MVFDFETDELVILNDKLYEVTYNSTDESFTIKSPEEIIYVFKDKVDLGVTIQSESYDMGYNSSPGGGYGYSTPENAQWYLTEIITPSASKIEFDYTDGNPTPENGNGQTETYVEAILNYHWIGTSLINAEESTALYLDLTNNPPPYNPSSGLVKTWVNGVSESDSWKKKILSKIS